MSGLEQVKTALTAALERAGITAVKEYGPERIRDYAGAVITVGTRRGESRQAGLCDYLGEQEDPETGRRAEVYGRRLDITLSLDAWADRAAGAAACQEALEACHEALLSGLPAGLRPGDMTWEEVRWDQEAGMFSQRGTLRCAAYLTATAQDETGMLSDFILKGVLTD